MKYHFFTETLDVLGYNISAEWSKPLEKNLDAITKFPTKAYKAFWEQQQLLTIKNLSTN